MSTSQPTPASLAASSVIAAAQLLLPQHPSQLHSSSGGECPAGRHARAITHPSPPRPRLPPSLCRSLRLCSGAASTAHAHARSTAEQQRHMDSHHRVAAISVRVHRHIALHPLQHSLRLIVPHGSFRRCTPGPPTRERDVQRAASRRRCQRAGTAGSPLAHSC